MPMDNGFLESLDVSDEIAISLDGTPVAVPS